MPGSMQEQFGQRAIRFNFSQKCWIFGEFGFIFSQLCRFLDDDLCVMIIMIMTQSKAKQELEMPNYFLNSKYQEDDLDEEHEDHDNLGHDYAIHLIMRIVDDHNIDDNDHKMTIMNTMDE